MARRQKACLTRSFRRLLSGEACAIMSVPSLMGFDETLGSMSSPERWDVSEDHLFCSHKDLTSCLIPHSIIESFHERIATQVVLHKSTFAHTTTIWALHSG